MLLCKAVIVVIMLLLVCHVVVAIAVDIAVVRMSSTLFNCVS